jgi:hypothetical protein
MRWRGLPRARRRREWNNRSGSKSSIPAKCKIESGQYVMPEFTNLTKCQFSIRIIAIECDGAGKDDNLGLFSSSVLGRKLVLYSEKITLVWLSEGKNPASFWKVFRA